jgi:hypothetical protein
MFLVWPRTSAARCGGRPTPVGSELGERLPFDVEPNDRSALEDSEFIF